MNLTRVQQITLALFIASLLPAYLIANWRYEAQLNGLTDMLEKEQALHKSTDKLLKNCEAIATDPTNGYGPTHQICNQGVDVHTHTESTMRQLEQDKAANEMKWYRNFGLAVVFLNLFALTLYRLNTYLRRESTS